MFFARPDWIYSATPRRLRSESVCGGTPGSTVSRDSSWPMFPRRRCCFPFFLLAFACPPLAPFQLLGGGCGFRLLPCLFLQVLPFPDNIRPGQEEVTVSEYSSSQKSSASTSSRISSHCG